MAMLKSGATSDLLTVDPLSKAARVTLYAPNGALFTELPPFADRMASGTLSAVAQTVVFPANGISAISVLILGTWVGTIQFQGSVDGVNFIPLTAADNGNNFVLSSNATVNSTYDIAIAGFNMFRLYMTAYTSGLASVNINGSVGIRRIIPIQLNPNNFNASVVKQDGNKASYSAAIQGISAANNATDLLVLSGSATKTIRVHRVACTAIRTAAGAESVQLIKRSTADTGGTFINPAAVPHDSNDAAATAVVTGYTANPTLGTSVGVIRARKLFIPTAGLSSVNGEAIFDFGQDFARAIVLRDVAQQLALNLNGVTIAGNNFDLSITWTEE